MPSFPSEEWFQAVQTVYNADSSLHSGGGGACDCVAGFRVGSEYYRIIFQGLECQEVGQSSESDLEDADFIIEMEAATWRSMLEDIQAHGKASSRFTLNSIDMGSEDSIARSPIDDQYRQDLFYRYNQNFQDFFDASSRIESTFK